MLTEEVLKEFSLTNEEIADFLSAYVVENGVPSDLEACITAATALLPIVLDNRRRLAYRMGALIVAETSLASSDIARPDYLPLQFLVKDIAQCVGLAPGLHPVATSHLDPKTQLLERVTILPYLEPDSPEVAGKALARMQGRAARRGKDAARETARATALANHVMYAWRLTGPENCRVCITRAANGAIYHDKTAANRFTHDNCDCFLEVVEDVTSWQGQAMADDLRDLIESHAEKSKGTYKNPRWPEIHKEYKERYQFLTIPKVG